MITNLSKLEKALVLLLVFLFPTQLALHFWPPFAFVFGIRVDYLAPTIYLTDILAFLVLATWFFTESRSIFKLALKNKYPLMLFLVLVSVNLFFSTSTLPTFYKWLKITEIGLMALYFANRLKVIGKINILKTVFLSLVTFSLVGILQFLNGGTLGGFMYWLGERSFTISTPGIALNNILGRDYLRAYSTFPHPNSLAGYLGISMILLLGNKFWENRVIKLLGLLVIVICFILTFSLSAFLGIVLVGSLALLLNRKKISQNILPVFFMLVVLLSMLMPIVSERLLSQTTFYKNTSERLDLAIISGRIINQNFWTGTGLNTFIINMTDVGTTPLRSSWLLQPVHNIFLLTLSEVGIFGLLLLVFWFYRLLKSGSVVFNQKTLCLIIVFIVITGFFDHYWLTIQQNYLLLYRDI